MEDKLHSEPTKGGFRPILPIPPAPPGFTYHLYRSPAQLLKPTANKLLRLRRQIPPLFQDLVSDGAIVMGSSDVEFICKGGEIAKAHRVILSLTSPFFCNLFRKQKPHKISHVSVPDIECKTMKSILLLCYKRDVSLLNEEDVLSVMTWVEEFGINRSSLHCGLINVKSPSTSQDSDSKSDPSNRQSTPQKRRPMPALVGAPSIASCSSTTPNPSQQSDQGTQQSNSSEKGNDTKDKDQKAKTPVTPNQQNMTSMLRFGVNSTNASSEGRTGDSPQSRILVRLDGFNNSRRPLPPVTYWMDSVERKFERSTDSNSLYLSPGPRNISRFSPVNAVLNIQQQASLVSSNSTPTPRQYSPDITRAHRDGRNSQYQSPMLNTPVPNPDPLLLTCPFCKLLMDRTAWRNHVSDCGISDSEKTPDPKKRIQPKQEKEVHVKRRMSGRQTSLPMSLRDHYVKETRSPPALIDSKTSLQRQLAAFTPAKKYLRLKKQQAMKAKTRRNGIKGALSAQNLKSNRAAATRLFRTAPRVPAECLKSAEKADEQERIRWLYVCLKCSISLDSSIKAHAHYLKCSPDKKYEDSVMKYRQGYYGNFECPLCPRKYTTIYGFVVHCIHNHCEYKKLLSHVISEDKLMCINCGDKFDGPTDFHQHLQNGMICSKPPKQELGKRKYKKMLNRRGLDRSPCKRMRTNSKSPLNYEKATPSKYQAKCRFNHRSDRQPYGLHVFDFTDASQDEENSPRTITQSDIANIFRTHHKINLASIWADYGADLDTLRKGPPNVPAAVDHCSICGVVTESVMEHVLTSHRDMGIDIKVINKEIIQCRKCALSFAPCDLFGHIKDCAESFEMDESALDLTKSSGLKVAKKPKAELVYPDGLGNSPLDSFDLNYITGPGLLQAFKCSVCQKGARKLALVADCLRKHGIHRCPICFNTYLTKERCNQHYRKCHIDQDGRAFCPLCFSTRSNIGQLAHHMYQIHWSGVCVPASPDKLGRSPTLPIRTETVTSVTAEVVRTDIEETPDPVKGTNQLSSPSESTTVQISSPVKIRSSPEPCQLVGYSPSPVPTADAAETGCINARKRLEEEPQITESDSDPSKPECVPVEKNQTEHQVFPSSNLNAEYLVAVEAWSQPNNPIPSSSET